MGRAVWAVGGFGWRMMRGLGWLKVGALFGLLVGFASGTATFSCHLLGIRQH